MQRNVPRLRFGIVIDREVLPTWQREVVRALADGGDAELCLLIRGPETHSPPETRSPLTLWRLYNNGVVARRARCAAPAGEWSALAPYVPVLDIEVERKGKWSQYVREGDVEAVRAVKLDFIVRFGLGIIRGGILEAARYGVWSFHHDDERVIRGGPPGFWELYDGLATSGVVLQRLTDRLDGGVPLARATFRSVLHSYPRNRDRTFVGAATLPAQVARATRLGLLDPNALPVSTSDAAIRHNPTNGEMLRFMARQARRAISIRARGVVRADRWAIGVAPPPDVRDGEISLRDIAWLPEREGDGYFADPFPAVRDGRTAILVEDFDEAINRGVISALERTDAGWRLHASVIDAGVHASYPFLVEDAGELFCVPETWQAGEVQLWRCVEFPTRWERAGSLLRGVRVIDPTVFRYGDGWWLLGTIKDDEPDAKLHAWSAPALAGPWSPHPLNPVKIDVTSSRPAGTPFAVDGALYRPAQDCSTAYGAGVVCNRVTSLDAHGLVEDAAGRVALPLSAYSSGTHTLASANGIWTVDGRRYVRSRHRIGREISARVRRLAPGHTARREAPLVLHVLPVDISRGAQTYAQQLRAALDGTDTRHRTLTLFHSAGGTLQPDDSLAVPQGRLRRLGLDPRAVFRLRRTLRAERPAVVVAHGGEPLKYAVLAGVPKRRLAYYKIGAGDARLTGPKRWMHRAMLRRASAIAAVSRDAADEAVALGVSDARVVVIPNGRDPSDFRAGARETDFGVVRLVFVGHMDESKRPERFIEVVRRLRSGGLDVEAAMAGSGPRLAEIEMAGKDAGIDVLGDVSDVPRLLGTSDVLVFTGRPPEGMPGVLIEAGLSGIPVVTTAVPGASDVVSDGDTGFVVPVDDFDALLRAVRSLVVDSDLRRRLGMAAQRRCTEHFSLAASVRRWRAVLAELVGGQCTSST